MDTGFYRNYFKIEKEHWLMLIRRKIITDNLTKFIAKRNNTTKILDFGCGSGIFVGELRAQGYDSYGLDVSKEAINFGQSMGVNNLSVIDSDKINFPNNTFEIVLAMDVLEHLEKPEWAISELYRVLSPGGIAIITVPAYMFLWGVQDDTSHHYRRYIKSTLLNEIKRSSHFKIIRVTYFNTFLFLPIAIFRLLSRFLGLKNRQSDFDINSPLLNNIFFTIFNTERKILKYVNFPFGISILSILKK